MTDVTAGVVDVDLADGVHASFTTSSANLAHHAGPGGPAVRRARQRLETAVGAPVAFATQVHGAHVHVLRMPVPAGSPDVAVADALVTARTDVALGVLVADCVPVLLADPAGGVVATAHAGRQGVSAGVVPRVVDAMVALGARPGDVRAVIGPAACGRCYEVPAELREEVAATVPHVASTTSWGTPALDLPGAVGHQLRSAGVGEVRSLGVCTIQDATWFSHRGATGGSRPSRAPVDRPTGRFAGVVRLAPACRRGRADGSG